MQVTEKYYSVNELIEITGLCRTTIWNLTKKGFLVATPMFGTRRIAYHCTELEKLKLYTHHG